MKNLYFISLLFLFFSFSVFLAFGQYQNTHNCNSDNCQLPDCYCPSFNIPGNLPLDKTPQFIFFTLDDSMYEVDYNRMSNFSWIFNNPNIRDSLNCPLKLSWYSLEICKFSIFFINFYRHHFF